MCYRVRCRRRAYVCARVCNCALVLQPGLFNHTIELGEALASLAVAVSVVARGSMVWAAWRRAILQHPENSTRAMRVSACVRVRVHACARLRSAPPRAVKPTRGGVTLASSAVAPNRVLRRRFLLAVLSCIIS